MKILALDTSTEYCSVALLHDGEILNQEVLAEQRHSELILPMVRRTLDDAGLTLRQLDGIAFGSGPGSFTGLRIACGVTQGLALGADLPVIGVCTLEALAQDAGEKTMIAGVIAALDARMGEIYHAAYKRTEDGWLPVSDPALCLPHKAPMVSADNWTACGSGFDMYGEILRSRYNGSIGHVISGLRPNARAILQLAAAEFRKGLGVDPADAGPLYIRNKVALKEKER